MSRLTVEVVQEPAAGPCRYEIRFAEEGGAGRKGLVWYEVEGALPPGRLEVLDFAVLALLFPAMHWRCDLRIRGAVTRRLLANLEEFQAAWHLWRPGDYKPIRIEADSVVSPPRQAWPKAVAAFSGGLDSAFTLLRHSRGLPGPATRPLAGAVMVHGFDIPLAKKAAFEAVLAKARPVLAGFGLPLCSVVTNWREVCEYDWEMEHAAALAACLHLFRNHAGAALVGGSYTYDDFVLPWGSNFATDGLLSGDDFEIVTDGQGVSRSRKAALVAEHRPLLDNLRVCWAGPDPAANCGVCRKCRVTQMNFLAIGRKPGASLPAELPALAVFKLRARKPSQLILPREIRTAARRNGVRGAWVLCLDLCLALGKLEIALRRLPRRLPLFRWTQKRLQRLAARRRVSGLPGRG